MLAPSIGSLAVLMLAGQIRLRAVDQVRSVVTGLFTACHCPSLGPFHCLSLPFPLAFHCLSLACHWLPLTCHCIPLTCHCLPPHGPAAARSHIQNVKSLPHSPPPGRTNPLQ